MPIFADVFYPDNPARRQQVDDLRAECRESFVDFETEWNKFASAINNALSQSKYAQEFNIGSVSYDPDNDDAQTMINQINNVLQNASSQLQELRSALSNDVPGFAQLEADLKAGTATVAQVTDFILEIGETIFSGFASYYTFNGIRIFIAFVNLADAGISDLASFLGGVFGGAVVGAVALIITDAIVSAIEGAIERKLLEDAISALEAFKSQVTDPLSTTASDVGAQYVALSQGVYRLNDNLLLILTNGQWQVIATGADDTQHAVVDVTNACVTNFGTTKAA